MKDAAIGWGLISPYDALTMTLDPQRPGPTMPGHDAPPTAAPPEAVGPVVLEDDPNAGPRQVGLWLAFVAVAAAVGLRLVQVLRRRPDVDGDEDLDENPDVSADPDLDTGAARADHGDAGDAGDGPVGTEPERHH